MQNDHFLHCNFSLKFNTRQFYNAENEHKMTSKNRKSWNFQILSDRPDRPIPAIWIGRIVGKSIFRSFPSPQTHIFRYHPKISLQIPPLPDPPPCFSTFFFRRNVACIWTKHWDLQIIPRWQCYTQLRNSYLLFNIQNLAFYKT